MHTIYALAICYLLQGTPQCHVFNYASLTFQNLADCKAALRLRTGNGDGSSTTRLESVAMDVPAWRVVR